MAISTTFTLKFAGAAVEKGLARVQSAFKSLGGVALKIGKSLISPFAGLAAAAGGILATGALAQVATELNKIGEEAFASEDRLKNVITSMGLFGDQADEVTKRLIDLGDEQARLTGIDDDVIRLTQSKLMTFKELAETADIVGGAFDRATMAAINMAAAGFGTAEMNAVQLGKALNDPINGINALTRSGITFTEKEKEKIRILVESNRTLEAQRIILDAIEKQVGGAAEATSTASSRMKQSWEQLKEEFAKPFSLGVEDAINKIIEKIPDFTAKFAEFGSLIGKTISDAVNGDLTRFFIIGSLIGEAIAAGIEMALLSIGGKISDFLEEKAKYLNIPAFLIDKAGKEVKSIASLFPPVGDAIKTAEQNVEKQEQEERQESFQSRAAELVKGLQDKYSEALTLPTVIPQKSAAHPYMPGFDYAPQGANTRMFDKDGIMVMESINRGIESLNQKLAPQP